MSQPVWKYVANLGDANPIDHGGLFVFVDETGVYAPEAELLEQIEEGTWEVHRFILEPCTYIDGILSDNSHHPKHPAWFAQPESERVNRPQDTTYLSGICATMDVEEDELIRLFCSNDPLERAQAWRMVGDYHGYENLDSYPLIFTDRAEVENRYERLNVAI